MRSQMLAIGAAALLALAATGAMAEDYVGGAIKSAAVGEQEILTDANGMTLYTFDKDTPGVSNCYDDCAVNWPPAFAGDDAVAEGDFTLVERTDGTQMWAYKGWPLYYWKDDTKPGDITGDGVGGVWHLAVE